MRRLNKILRMSCLLAGVLTIVTLFAGVSKAADALKTSAPATETKTNSPWKRIVMIGASVTAGFTASEPLGGANTRMLRLSRYVDAALLAEHEPVQNFGNALLFLQPDTFGRQQISQALKANPTLVIAVDFPFWFCYGDGKTDAERLERFERGLKLLEEIDCPLVLGDLPDASAAVGGMLRPDQMPSQKALAAANKRLKQWAKARKNVVIVPLSTFMENAMADRAITIGEFTVPAGKTRALLQADKLHPNPQGCAVVALAVLNTFQASRPDAPEKEFLNDAREVFRKALNPVAAKEEGK